MMNLQNMQEYNLKMKFLKSFVKNFVLRSDMFAAQPTLRFNGQSSYETIFGGCLSILLVLTFMIIFSRSFINVINKVNVSASLNIEDNPYDSSEISDIKLAIGIGGLNFSQSQRYFNIILKVTSIPLGGSRTSQQIQLSPCQLDDWKDLGQNFEKLFDVYSMSSMLCPSSSQNLTIEGFAGSDNWVTMTVMVQQCRNLSSTNWTCYSPHDIQTRFRSQLMASDFMKVNFLILNNIISPQQENPIKAVLQNEIFVTFSNTSGSRCEVKLGKYEITTDNSIWPFSMQQSIEGYYVTNHESYTVNLYSTHYVKIQIQKARTIYQVSRTHDKLDEMLSYVGGLFALLFGWLLFFIGSYNQYKYEIAIGQHTFAIDQTGRKVRQDHFGFFNYLRYALYDWIKSFGIPIRWAQMQQFDAARQQANEQMDVRYLMKKIQHFQKINKILLGEHNLICASLTRPPTLDQARRLRKITQYYDKVIKVESQQIILKNILNLAMKQGDSNMINNKIANESTLNKQMGEQQKKQQQIQLQSEDQQIQQQIAQIFKQNYKNYENNSSDELTTRIMEGVPQSIQDRFKKLQQKINSQQKQKVKLRKQKASRLKIQSSFQLADATPGLFIKGFKNAN